MHGGCKNRFAISKRTDDFQTKDMNLNCYYYLSDSFGVNKGYMVFTHTHGALQCATLKGSVINDVDFQVVIMCLKIHHRIVCRMLLLNKTRGHILSHVLLIVLCYYRYIARFIGVYISIWVVNLTNQNYRCIFNFPLKRIYRIHFSTIEDV